MEIEKLAGSTIERLIEVNLVNPVFPNFKIVDYGNHIGVIRVREIFVEMLLVSDVIDVRID